MDTGVNVGLRKHLLLAGGRVPLGRRHGGCLLDSQFLLVVGDGKDRSRGRLGLVKLDAHAAPVAFGHQQVPETGAEGSHNLRRLVARLLVGQVVAQRVSQSPVAVPAEVAWPDVFSEK